MKTLFGKSVTALAKDFGNVTVNEYRILAPNLAQVTITCASFADKNQILDKLAESLEGRAAPIQSSFRWLEEKRHAIGYVALARTTRVVEDEQQLATAGFKEVSKNVFLEGENVWELKEGAAGKYLVRNSEGDDLSELLEEARMSPVGSTPRMSRIQAATAKPHEFVAFINTDAIVPFMDYGFCVASTESSNEYRVVSTTTGQETKVSQAAVAGVYNLKGEQFEYAAKENKLRLVKAQMFDPKPVVEYYKKFITYSPEYLAKVIKQIENLAAM
jgi:hypothetical protein